MKKIIPQIVVLFFSIFVISSSAFAGEKEDIAKIKSVMAKQMPGEKITQVKATPLPGIYEVVMPPKILYVSASGEYVFSGDIIKVSDGMNITQPMRDKVRVEAIDMLGESSMIVYAPKKVKHTVTVFTDIDCGYCRKLHNEMADYNKLGIKVRYLAFPRAGIGSDSYKKAVSVWCANNRNTAMTSAKNGKDPKAKDCKNPVAAHYKLGEQLGIRGTPALVIETGQVVPGYVPADRLFAGLEQQKKAN